MSLADELGSYLPYLRRYARALSGSQEEGDAFIRATLAAVAENPDRFLEAGDIRTGLYKMFHAIWTATHVQWDWEAEPPAATRRPNIGQYLEDLSPDVRQALLLTETEGFSAGEAAEIVGTDVHRLKRLRRDGLTSIERRFRTKVLIVEDEPAISIYVEEIVRDLGHEVSDTVTTRSEAVAAALKCQPGLVVADIQLRDGSSGLDAVKDISFSTPVPAIFVTAFPDELLWEDDVEQRRVVAKPFRRGALMAAISETLFLEGTAIVSV